MSPLTPEECDWIRVVHGVSSVEARLLDERDALVAENARLREVAAAVILMLPTEDEEALWASAPDTRTAGNWGWSRACEAVSATLASPTTEGK